MPRKSNNAKILMTVLAIKHYESITRINKTLDGDTIDHKERERQIINQRRRQQYKK